MRLIFNLIFESIFFILHSFLEKFDCKKRKFRQAIQKLKETMKIVIVISKNVELTLCKNKVDIFTYFSYTALQSE